MKIAAKLIILAVVFLAGFYYGQKQATAPAITTTGLNPDAQTTVAENQAEENTISVDLSIDKGNGEVKKFNGFAMASGTNVFDLLETATRQNGIDLQYKDYGGDLGVMILAIAGISGDFASNRYWQYWFNDEYALVGASSQVLHDGDKVEWKYTAGQK